MDKKDRLFRFPLFVGNISGPMVKCRMAFELENQLYAKWDVFFHFRVVQYVPGKFPSEFSLEFPELKFAFHNHGRKRK